MAEEKSAINGEESAVLRNDSLPFGENVAALKSPIGEEYGTSKPEDGYLTVWLVLTASTCFLGSSFQFGYNLGVVNAPKDVSLYITISFRIFIVIQCILIKIFTSN